MTFDDPRDPRQAILAVLASEAPGHEIDLSTVRFGQEKASAQHLAHVVTYQGSGGETARGRPGRMTFFLTVGPDGGWRVSSFMAHDRPPCSRAAGARAYLGGGHEVDGLHAAGFVDGAGAAVDRVQLRAADGRVVEDRPEGGFVLFAVDGPMQPPVTVALISSEGDELASHPILPG